MYKKLIKNNNNKERSSPKDQPCKPRRRTPLTNLHTGLPTTEHSRPPKLVGTTTCTARLTPEQNDGDTEFHWLERWRPTRSADPSFSLIDHMIV